MTKFQCENCGQCCSKFGKKGLPLFDFEVERIQNLAECSGPALKTSHPPENSLHSYSGPAF